MIQGINHLNPILNEMASHWPKNKTVNIVCHGHSVPAGYFATPFVNTFSAYPHLMHKPSDLAKYLSHTNHPTEAGHLLVAEEIAKYFIAR